MKYSNSVCFIRRAGRRLSRNRIRGDPVGRSSWNEATRSILLVNGPAGNESIVERRPLRINKKNGQDTAAGSIQLR